MNVTGTEIQGMMSGSWQEGTEIDVTENVTAICLDGRLWELRGGKGQVILTLNPTSALTCRELRQELERAVSQNQSGAYSTEYNQSGVSD